MTEQIRVKKPDFEIKRDLSKNNHSQNSKASIEETIKTLEKVF